MFVWRWNKVDGKIWRENMNKNFFRECLVSWGGRKINGGAWMFFLQNREKTRWNAFFLDWQKYPCAFFLDWQKWPCASTHGLRLVAFFLFFLFFLIFFNFYFLQPRCDSCCCCCFFFFFFFFDRCDFFLTWFFINKFGWLLSLFSGYLSLFCFN